VKARYIPNSWPRIIIWPRRDDIRAPAILAPLPVLPSHLLVVTAVFLQKNWFGVPCPPRDCDLTYQRWLWHTMHSVCDLGSIMTSYDFVEDPSSFINSSVYTDHVSFSYSTAPRGIAWTAVSSEVLCCHCLSSYLHEFRSPLLRLRIT